MSGMVWGVDSLEQCDAGNHCGCGSCGTLAWYTKQCFYAPDSIIFWGRYFDNADWPNNLYRFGETSALLDQVIHWVLPIAQPGQWWIANGSYNDGYDHGNRFCNNMQNAGYADGRVHLSGTCKLYAYLDVEADTLISTDYWRGWATAVNQFRVGAQCILPIYACAYLGSIGTGNGTTNCDRIASVSSGWATCYGIWSNQPQGVGGCNQGCSSPGPDWGPNNCSQFTTFAWQYGIQGGCNPNCSGCAACWGPNTPVDLDSTNPTVTGPFGNDLTDYMIWLN